MALVERGVWLLALAAVGTQSTDNACGSCTDCLDRRASEHALLQRRVALSEIHEELPEADEAGSSLLTPKLDTYVVNLDARRDRCGCMALQLADAPQAVYRQAAVVEGDCPHLKDDTETLYGDRNHTSEKSLFCSNYKIWQRALESNTDFVVVMEDDAILRPSFWSSVHDFVAICPHFDYVAVDSWEAGGQQARDAVDVCSAEGATALFRPSTTRRASYWGTQVQIIRRSFLKTLVQRAELHGMGPLDVWWQTHVNDGRAFSWQPGISLQAWDGNVDQLMEGCSHDVTHSDIVPVQKKGPISHVQVEGLPRLQCI